MYLGSWQIDDAVPIPVNTHDASTGAANVADANPMYRIYENGAVTPMYTGDLLPLDAGNTVGFYTARVTLSAANGFDVGRNYFVYVQAVVNGVLGTLTHTFQIGLGANLLPAAIKAASYDGVGAFAQSGDNYPVVTSRLPTSLLNGRMQANMDAIKDDAGAATNQAAGANQLTPFVVGAGPTSTSIPTGITGLPFTNANHFRGANVYINQERRRINASGGSPVVLTTDEFQSVPSQNDLGVIA